MLLVNQEAMDFNYIASQPYDLRPAEPPRLIVPPPSMQYVNNRPFVAIAGVASYDYQGEFGDPNFLQMLASRGCDLGHRMLEWRYEERRKAQAILPYLYLGPSSAAQDKDFLTTHGITLLFAVRHSDTLQARLVTSLKKAEVLALDTAVVVSSTALEMMKQLPGAIKTINDHLQHRSQDHDQRRNGNNGEASLINGKALIFCENGIDRSPIIVIGYLMAMYNLNTVEAIQAVQSQRFCIAIDDSMKQMLLDFEGILKAKRDVMANDRAYNSFNGGNIAHSQPIRSHKRSLDDVDEYEDDPMELEGNAEDRERDIRAGSAPFRDWE